MAWHEKLHLTSVQLESKVVYVMNELWSQETQIWEGKWHISRASKILPALSVIVLITPSPGVSVCCPVYPKTLYDNCKRFGNFRNLYLLYLWSQSCTRKKTVRYIILEFESFYLTH